VIFPDGKRVIVLAKGRLVNLGCGNRASVVRDVKLVLESDLGANRALDALGQLPQRGVHPAEALDEHVARLHLRKIGAN